MNQRAAVAWLLCSDEPAIRSMTRRDLLGEPADDDAARILTGPKVTTLLSGQQADGGFGPKPLHWATSLWRLVSLVELAVPTGEPRCLAAADDALTWLLGRRHHRGRLTVIDGLPRFCASGDGLVLAACCRVGQVGPGVDRVEVTLEDGSEVRARVHDGGTSPDGRRRCVGGHRGT